MDIKPKSFKNDYETTFILTPELPENELHAAVEKYVSLIKDHGGESAASLIERAGLKGTQVGNVEILDRNCNYFVAQSGASSADFLRLVDLVRRQVEDRLDIKLALAIQVW